MTLLAFRPFIDPIPIVSWQKLAMLLPLCLAIAIVYKTTKCRELRDVPESVADGLLGDPSHEIFDDREADVRLQQRLLDEL